MLPVRGLNVRAPIKPGESPIVRQADIAEFRIVTTGPAALDKSVTERTDCVVQITLYRLSIRPLARGNYRVENRGTHLHGKPPMTIINRQHVSKQIGITTLNSYVP